RGLAAAARAHEHRQPSQRHIEVDSSERLDASLSGAEDLRHAEASYRDAGLERRVERAHRNTAAGSSTRTRRMLMRLASTMTTMTATPVPSMTGQSSTMPRRARTFFVVSKNAAASPMPMP